MTSGVGGMVKAKLFWFCGPQLIGFFFGLLVGIGIADKIAGSPYPKERHQPTSISQTAKSSPYTDNIPYSQATNVENEERPAESAAMTDADGEDDSVDSWPGESENSSGMTPVGNVGQINGTKVNMRAAASTDSRVIYQFPGWEHVTILDKTAPAPGKYPWYKVSYGDMTGWVYGQFLKTNR